MFKKLLVDALQKPGLVLPTLEEVKAQTQLRQPALDVRLDPCPKRRRFGGRDVVFVGELIGDAVWGFGRHTGFRPSCQKHEEAPFDDGCHWYGVMERVDVSEEIDAVRSICFPVECFRLVSFPASCVQVNK